MSVALHSSEKMVLRNHPATLEPIVTSCPATRSAKAIDPEQICGNFSSSGRVLALFRGQDSRTLNLLLVVTPHCSPTQARLTASTPLNFADATVAKSACAGKRWDEHILVNVVVLYLNPHPGMLTKDAIMVMTGAHRCLPLSEGGAAMTSETVTRKLKQLGSPRKNRTSRSASDAARPSSIVCVGRERRSPGAIQVACRRLPLTFLPTTSRIIVRVSLAASSGGRAVSATLLTNLVMS
jgi:hypothetical protein